MYGDQVTTIRELKRWGKELGIKGLKVLMRDEIPKKINTEEYYAIINLETSKEDGSHFDCIHANKRFSIGIYFSSYALPPVLEVEELFKDLDYKCYNKIKLQKLEESFCGVISLYVLYRLFYGSDIVNVILELKEEIPKLRIQGLIS